MPLLDERSYQDSVLVQLTAAATQTVANEGWTTPRAVPRLRRRNACCDTRAAVRVAGMRRDALRQAGPACGQSLSPSRAAARLAHTPSAAMAQEVKLRSNDDETFTVSAEVA